MFGRLSVCSELGLGRALMALSARGPALCLVDGSGGWDGWGGYQERMDAWRRFSRGLSWLDEVGGRCCVAQGACCWRNVMFLDAAGWWDGHCFRC